MSLQAKCTEIWSLNVQDLSQWLTIWHNIALPGTALSWNLSNFLFSYQECWNKIDKIYGNYREKYILSIFWFFGCKPMFVSLFIIFYLCLCFNVLLIMARQFSLELLNIALLLLWLSKKFFFQFLMSHCLLNFLSDFSANWKSKCLK